MQASLRRGLIAGTTVAMALAVVAPMRASAAPPSPRATVDTAPSWTAHAGSLDDLLVHRVGGRATLAPYYGGFGMPANSDFAPVLDLNAARARFRREQVDDMPRLMEAPIPVLALFDRTRARRPDPTRPRGTRR